ncbi:hypothetical protein CCUN_0382 [Campylobacter cuniculorum DSM 23162 = LMG 24588]|uniref:Uncharacterized protein n=1 Tax=Campylobacter cuniculorum DSM 23162 = LMG 24588 TaxID=1121267 RepID=A0A1W6BVD1_9BACT|nr:hypothetical protein CCUN_0382 [Campylobacter cuniculorum DSM 23162 = LMG 24588]
MFKKGKNLLNKNEPFFKKIYCLKNHCEKISQNFAFFLSGSFDKLFRSFGVKTQ